MRNFLFIILSTLICVDIFSAESNIILKVSNAKKGVNIYSSFCDLRDKIKDIHKNQNNKDVIVYIDSGFYELNECLDLSFFTSENQHNLTFVGHGNVILSGGKRLKGWKNIKDNHWVLFLPEVKKGDWYFRQLFSNGKRLTRARTPNSGFHKTKGSLSKYKNMNLWKYFAIEDTLLQKQEPIPYFESRCGFAYKDDQFKYWSDWKQAEILTYHSWETSWQSILAIDTINKDVYFCTPSQYPVGTFGQEMRYRIENIMEALDEEGEWYLNKEEGVLHYLAKEGENPNEMNIVAPVLSKILNIEGEINTKVSNIKFKNIKFENVDYELGHCDLAPNWPKEIQRGIPYFPSDLRPGYNDMQAAPNCGAAVFIKDASNIIFDQCAIKHVGGIGLKIDKGCKSVVLQSSEVSDTGGGGVYIGFPERDVYAKKIPKEVAPSFNIIRNCKIHNIGSVHPAAVGIWIAQSYNNLIENNELSDISSCGISLGWCWGKEKNYTMNNQIKRNYIHDVAQLLGDCAGIYTLGDMPGTIFYGNYLNDIYKGDGVHGVVDAMGFDASSKGVVIESNVVGRISGKVASFAKENSPELHIWKNNNFDLLVDRPVISGKEIKESNNFIASATFNTSSTFLNLNGWLEEKWIFRKNGGLQEDGFWGLLIEGKKLIGVMNIGGGNENIVKIKSGDILEDDQIVKTSLKYDSGKLTIILNDKVVSTKNISNRREIANKNLEIAPVGPNSLRESVLEFNLKDVDMNKVLYQWKASKKKHKINEKKVIKMAGIK